MSESVGGLTAESWLDLIQREYLSEYVPSGGSAVKVITGPDAVLEETASRIELLAKAGSFYYARLDPSVRDESGKRPDLHRIEKFFFAVSRDVDWKRWAATQARRYLESSGIQLEEGRELGDVEGIAADNGRDPQDLIGQYQREMATPQIRDTRLSIEFRAAVTALGRALLIPDAVSPTTEEVLLGWFAGRSMPGSASALKKIQIFERIQQTNARPMLASFCRWLPNAGLNGLVVTFDFRPYEYKRIGKGRLREQLLARVSDAVAAGASRDEIARIMEAQESLEPDVIYSDGAYMQMLTMIRRFIDEMDRFERFLLVILTTPDFYRDKSVDPTVRRCYFDYDALQTRIGQEVHDRRYANPAAALVRLGGVE